MSTFIALIFICAPTVFFGWRLIYEWGGSLDSNSEHWRFYTIAPLILMLAYFYITLFCGADAIKSFYSITGKAYEYTNSRRYASIFVWPGLGFGIATFPKQAAELLGDYLTLAKVRALNWFAVIGWLLIMAWLIKTAIALTY